MKHVRIEINGVEWVNGDFEEVQFSDGRGGVKVEARTGKAPQTGGGGAGLLDLLASASRARQAAVEDPEPEPERPAKATTGRAKSAAKAATAQGASDQD